MKFSEIILIITAILTALIAGLLFSYSFSVMLGLRKLPDVDFIKTMQSINREIQNPVFFICFFGAFFLLPISTILQYKVQKTTFIFLLLATFAYSFGVICVTIFGNVPLNNTLDKFDIVNESLENIKLQRESFENNWNKLHDFRTFSSFLALIFVIFACIFYKRE